MLPPLIITKVKYNDDFTYRVTYNYVWNFINDFNQLKDVENWKEVKEALLPIEREKKINRLMGRENKIYTNVLYKK